MWWIRSETAWDGARSARSTRRGCCRFIQNGTASHGAEAEQGGAGKMIEHPVELLGRTGLVGPTQSQTRSEPSPGRADQAGADQIGPATQGAPRNHGLARAGEQGPLVGLLDPVAQHVHNRLQNRTDRRSPAPQRSGGQRNGGAVAEYDAQDRDLFEHVAGRQIPHPLAVPLGVGPGAMNRVAGRTNAT